MKKELIIVRYGEIGIKGPIVRKRFENRLLNNIKSALECRIEVDQGRIFLHTDDQELARQVLSKTFGVVSFSPAVVTETDFDYIKEKLKAYTEELVQEGLFSGEDSFAIRCRRVGKHSFTSQQMAAFCGSVVYGVTQSKVDLTRPDFEIFLEVREDETYLFHQKIPGPGGLPVGTQGRVVALLSTGIDSPVACYLMMKRGCSITALHFNNHPYTSPDEEKIKKISEKLKEYSHGARFDLFAVDYGEFLSKCIEDAPSRMTCVLCKSGMYQTAEKLAQREGALALVDGNSLGQVASQTLPNLVATRHFTTLPLLSPLIGWDKVEIENLAKKIGTYTLSIIPEEGCSAAPRHPETHAELEKVVEAQNKLKMDKEVDNLAFSLRRMKI
ncbi:MAG: tRNA uracil 4-sulfurtransferase ThiI [Methanobacteriaceae archaeon]|nr:tRNA uracil 4-sulfurtransferase ThiI [Methanobacteriaceae archaeon]